MTAKFLETTFTANEKRTYIKNGFLPCITLIETFTNKYTKTSEDKLQVRAMKAEDLYIVTGLIEMKTGKIMNLNDEKYENLIINGGDYWIYTNDNMWTIFKNGDVNSHRSDDEFGVRPVVSLSFEVKASSKDMIGAWNIEI